MGSHVGPRCQSLSESHSEHRFPAPSSKEGCRKPVLGICVRIWGGGWGGGGGDRVSVNVKILFPISNLLFKADQPAYSIRFYLLSPSTLLWFLRIYFNSYFTWQWQVCVCVCSLITTQVTHMILQVCQYNQTRSGTTMLDTVSILQVYCHHSYMYRFIQGLSTCNTWFQQ